MKGDIKPVRRIIAANDENGDAVILEDKPSPDVKTDDNRPGYSATRIWVQETTPAPIAGVRETLHLADTLEPPKAGSVCRFVTIPPDAWHIESVTEEKVSDYFTAAGSPGAYRPGSTHPYMQNTGTLDYVFVMEGDVTLVLEAEEVQLSRGDTVVQLGATHAWSNRSEVPCRLFISSHDGA